MSDHDLETRVARLEAIVFGPEEAPTLIEEKIQADIDRTPDDKGISPKMYREHEAEAQKLVDSGEAPDIETARANFDNLLRREQQPK